MSIDSETMKWSCSAYLQAAIDFQNGHTFEADNPYPVGSKEHEIWDHYLKYLTKEFPDNGFNL